MFRAIIPILLLTLSALVSPAFAQWGQNIPQEIRESYLEPNQVLSETPCDWRQKVQGIFAPAVKHCTTAREAVMHIAANMTQLTGTYYSAKRRKQDMNALEALEEKKISCTGQTILMVCAFRSIGIPARAVGIPTWNHVRGNHTWPEVWLDGEWQMIEFNEKDFNTGWVMENIGMLDASNIWQRIVAQNPKGDMIFPVGDMLRNNIAAEDVTERYTELAAQWYSKNGLPADRQRLLLDLHPRAEEAQMVKLVDETGAILEEQPLPTTRDDMRKFATFSLPRKGLHYLIFPGNQAFPIQATEAPVNVLRLKRR
ncbi:MAG: hypothetical protein II295_04390 [Akkermansia sp.]|nr:hypothetical protein [Akkermansia sp.]